MAEVEILELIQKNDEHGVANVVHVKQHFDFRNQMETHEHVWRTSCSKLSRIPPAISIPLVVLRRVTGWWRLWNRPAACLTLGCCQKELLRMQRWWRIDDRDATLLEMSAGETN